MDKKPIVLLYNILDSEKRMALNIVLTMQGADIKYIEEEDQGQAIGYLAGDESIARIMSLEIVSGEMMVICHADKEKLGDILAAINAFNIPPIPCKAVMTDVNKFWTGSKLYEELRKEHEKMT